MPIRLLTPDDAPAYLALRREMLVDSPLAFASSPGDDRFRDEGVVREFVSHARQAIVGAFADDGGLVGSVGLRAGHRAKMGHRAHVWGVYVSPPARGRGLGEAMMRRAVAVAAGWGGVTSVALSVSARSHAAIAVYERVGFRAWGVEPGAVVLDGACVDEVHMVMMLDGARVAGSVTPSARPGR
ncbi:MAG: GNAT family N-acetyltransferase [Phycisphaeraceae bacterium]|nr:GNAT family N-acetyltransferase [Phycisphaeraceae bacterium]